MSERLPPQPEELIDRSASIEFSFEGKDYSGFSGDTISSALWANGVRVLGRSFKYHRPRGIYSMAGVDCNAMMEGESETNIRGDLRQIEDGLNVRAVNTIGGVVRDLLKIMDRFGAFTPVGFYYKAFHTPRGLFPFYENQIRKVAGLGAVNTNKRTSPTPKEYAFCDVLVVGGGPAGMSAAFEAAGAGAQVLLVDENTYLGGSLRYQERDQNRLDELLRRIEAAESLEVRTGTLAAGLYAEGWVGLVDDEKLTKLRAGSVVVASGVYEQPAVFRNNDLPGVMLASGAQRLMRLYAVKPFSAVTVLAANQEAYEAALDFQAAGIRVAAVVDLRESGEATPVGKKVADGGIPVYTGSVVNEAIPGRGKKSIKGVVVRSLDGADNRVVQCDGLAMSVGWTPADGLLRQAGTVMTYDSRLEQFIPSDLPPGIFAGGSVNGVYALDDRVEDGRCAGHEAVRHLGLVGENPRLRPERECVAHSHPYPVVEHPKGKNFVDLDEDVTLKDIVNACQEGFDKPELLKRYTTIGMGPSQGKHSNLPALRILTKLRDEEMQGKQITTARPFSSPVKLSHLAGRTFTPLRRTPIHSLHASENAAFMHAGSWLRPEYYRVGGCSREQCIAGEVKNVRENVGLMDVGTLGKIEVSGPDVVEFVQRLYTGLFAKLHVWKCRYGIMCDESGTLIDDGLIARLSEKKYYISTTSSGSDAVYRTMQRKVIEWGLDVSLVNATNHYQAMSLSGPRSRDLLEKLVDIDLCPENFPYLGVREGNVAGVPSRLARVGFVGELGFEIHLKADGGSHVWNAIMDVGKPFGIRPFGVEAQRILRLEKGHIIVGQDTDGLTQPFEAGLSWAVKMGKPFFIGQRSLAILQRREAERALVGFVIKNGSCTALPMENNLIIENDEMVGRVTSIAMSPTLGNPIGLAYVKPNRTEPGTRFHIRLGNGFPVGAEVVELPFYDPEGLRQKV